MAPFVAIAMLGPASPLAVAQEMSRDASRAMMVKDVAYFERHMEPDYVYIAPNGQPQTKSQVLAGLRAALAMVQGTPKVTSRIVSAKREGAGLVFVEDKSMTGRVGDGSRSSTFVSKTRTEVHLVRRNGLWMVRRSKVLTNSAVAGGRARPGA